MGRLITSIMVTLAALSLGACDAMGDRLVRGMASDEQIARYENVITLIANEDVSGLEAIMHEDTREGYAQEVIDYMPDTAPNSIVFTRFNSSVNFSGDGRRRTDIFEGKVYFDGGGYFVRMDFFARAEAPLRLTRLDIYPLDRQSQQTNPGSADDDRTDAGANPAESPT